MNRRVARDWSREPWIKQHIREPLRELLWPLMQRALRDYLRKRAEADGALIVDQEEPVHALVRALGAHEPELALVREAIGGLIRDGILETDGRAIWMPERAESQVRPSVAEDARDSMPSAPTVSKRTSTERVREHRMRKRNAAAGVSPLVPGDTDPVSLLVSSAVPVGVSSSRGDQYSVSLVSEKDQKEQKDPHLHSEEIERDARVSPSVSLAVSSPVEEGDEGALFPQQERSRVDDRHGPHSLAPASLAEALRIEVTVRAGLVLDMPGRAEKLRPDQWPEVEALATAFARARNCSRQPLGRYAQDKVVELAVALYAAGYSQAELVHVITTIANQEWAKGKGLGSLLTFKVADNNRPKPPVKAEAKLSPRAAEALARARESLRKPEAG